MSQDEAVVRAMYAGFSELARGADVAAYVTAHYDEACEYHPVEEADAIHGHDALIAWNSRWFEAWEVFQAEVEDLRELDGVFLTCINVTGRGEESGMKVGQRIFHVIELRAGKILRMREFVDREAALQAAEVAGR